MLDAIKSFIAMLLVPIRRKPLMKARILNINETVSNYSEYDGVREDLGL